MKVFISWSGDRSRLVGELLDDWIQCVLQAVDPWMSSKDIDRGSLWFSEITDQLKDTSIGIILLTQENKDKPWILFESGALAKGLSTNRVCTLLIDLQPTDIRDPLAQFNHTYPNREGLWQLVRTLNASLSEKGLKEKVLERVFDTYWPQFERDFAKVLSTTNDTLVSESKRTNDDMMVELLSSIRNVEKRMRAIDKNPQLFDREHVRYINRETAEIIIRRLLDFGAPLEVITDTMEGLVPNGFIKRTIERRLTGEVSIAVSNE